MKLYKAFPTHSDFLKIIIIMCSIQCAISVDCSPPSGEIKCICDAVTMECTGTQTDILEVQNILINASSIQNVLLKINDLKFDPDFKFENMTFKNITLGYGLGTPASDFLLGLSSTLISLNLQNNSIQFIDDHLFSTVALLKELFLDINEVNDLKSSMFINLKKLEYLSIVSNTFNKVNSDVFENMPLLQTLALSHNNISLIDNVQIKSSSLFTLRIDNCMIQGSLEKDMFSDLPNLEYLDISHNKLSEVQSNSLSSLKNLLFFNLSYNVIEFLRENAFSELHNLTTLDLKGNKISVIARTSFAKLLNLKFLDLSGNKLKAVLCDYTSDFTSLERIYLQNNEIKSFTTGAFFYSPSLKELNLSDNNLECSCAVTETVHYLIENSTMKKDDFNSVLCIIPTALTQIAVTDYKSSKCIPEEPCKKIISDEDDDYYDDDEITTSNTGNITVSLPISTTEVLNSSTSVITETSTVNLTSVHTLTSTLSTTVESTSIEISSVVHSTTNSSTTKNSTTESYSFFKNSTAVYSNDTTAPPSVINTAETTIFENFTTETDNVTTSHPTESSITYTSSKILYTTLSEKGSNSSSTDVCSSLDLFVESISGSELTIIKNFSYDGNVFCLKWTVGGPVSSIIRCTIKYTFIKGSKSENIICPSFENEVKIWSKIENMYNFCLKIYGKKNIDSCAKVSEVPGGSSLKTTDSSTRPIISTITVSESTLETVTETAKSASVNYTDSSTAETNATLSHKTSSSTLAENTAFIPVNKIYDFNVTLLQVYFNDSSFAYVKWVVNLEEPLQICNLTLTVTTQYFDHNEGNYPCKNNIVQLESVKDSDIFKVCLISFHKVNDYRTMCKYSLADLTFDAEASKSKEKSSHNASLIPLICLLVLLVLLVIFIIFKNVFKKKLESDSYDVRAEEEKAEKVQIRSSTHERSSVRYSYIAKQNEDA